MFFPTLTSRIAGPPAIRSVWTLRACETIPQSPLTPRAAAPAGVKEFPKPKKSKPSCSRSRGGMRGWPVHRPTHAPATYARTTGTRHTREKTRTPRAAAPAAACVAGRSRARERIPLRHRSNLQRKKQHRHSGIFRVADLGPGTMPRGKYPESPAPAGSHALISRTPTPGGMLHANLGLPRPPPRNFQPPLPQQPPKQTQQRRHNVPPVQSLRDSAAATPVGCAAWRRRFRIFSFRYREMMSGMTTGGFFHTLSRGQHMLPQQPSKQTATAPPPKPKTPRAVTLWRHACLTTPVVKPSPPQTPSVQTTTTPKPSSFRNLRRKAGMPPHWRECEAPLRRTQRNGADETILCRCVVPKLRECETTPQSP